jgi:hypothetical protein
MAAVEWRRGRLRWIVVGVLLGVVAVALVGWLLTGAGAENLAGWVEATATLAALLAAIVAGAYASAAFRLEVRRDEIRVTTDRRAQASLVAAWLEFVISEDAGLPYHQLKSIVIRLRNASELPVTSVRFDVIHLSPFPDGVMEQHMHGDQVAVLPPATSPLQIEWKDNTAVTQAEHEWRNRGHQGAQRFGLELLFRDAAGIHWKRDWQGHLTEVMTSA